MGNCIWRRRQQQLEELENGENISNYEQEIIRSALEETEGSSSSGKETSGGMRIKIVLTKEELELLLFQLQNKQGQRLEDVLDEIERGRGRSTHQCGWKPSLESITESPEVPDQMLR